MLQRQISSARIDPQRTLAIFDEGSNRAEWDAARFVEGKESSSIISRGAAMFGADPQRPRTIEVQRADLVIGEPVDLVEVLKSTSAIAEQSAFRSYPECAVRSDCQRENTIEMMPRTVDAIHAGKVQSIEPGEPSERPDPEISVWRTCDSVYRVLREPVDRRPLIEAIRRRGCEWVLRLCTAQRCDGEPHG
jgi:hypothetical protein